MQQRESVQLANPQEGAANITNNEKDLPADLWHIHGHSYDLSTFVKKHPGGETAINLGKGRDCTAMFESYHAFTNRHRLVLRQYATTEEGMKAATEPLVKDEFYEVLSTRCKAKLKAVGCLRPYKANNARWMWYAAVLSLLIWSWTLYARAYIAGVVLFPVASWLMVALGHDSSHFATCTVPWLNGLGSILGMLMIASPFFWYNQHTYAHHSHTNESHVDPDMHHTFWFRLCEETTWKYLHRAQASRIYTYLMWSVTAVGDALVLPIESLYTMHVSYVTEILENEGSALGGKSYLLATLAHITVYIVIIGGPLWFVGGVISGIFVTLHIAITGWLFGFFSQINHINESAQAASANFDKDGKPRSWSVKQVECSVNWGNGSLGWFLFSNGLNYQIEHHLFPGVNHVHLHHIAGVVKDTCKEYGVNYQALPTFWSACCATADWYTKLSVKPSQE